MRDTTRKRWVERTSEIYPTRSALSLCVLSNISWAVETFKWLEPQCTSMDEEFVLGVIASEGSFHLKMMKTGTNAGYSFSPTFVIHMNNREEKLLRNVAEVLPVDPAFYEREDSVTLYVGGKDSVRKVIKWTEEQNSEMFNEAAKSSSATVLKQIIDKLDAGLHSTPEGTVEIAQLRNQMNAAGADSRTDIAEVRETVGLEQ